MGKEVKKNQTAWHARGPRDVNSWPEVEGGEDLGELKKNLVAIF